MSGGVDARGVIRNLIGTLGGRFSTEAGIDVDGGPNEIDRWFLAATLFGTRISAAIAMRTYRILSSRGVDTIDDAARRHWEELVRLLDTGGYARYDERTATRLHDLAKAVAERYADGIAAFGSTVDDPDVLTAALDELPGWGPVTVGAFLRELRGVWPAADPPIDQRVARAARHLGLVDDSSAFDAAALAGLAEDAVVDERDLESALIRLALAHERSYDRCESSGGAPCSFFADSNSGRT